MFGTLVVVAGTQLRLEDELGTFTIRAEAPSMSGMRINARPEIARLQAAGLGWSTIARTLNARGVPTPSGRGRWHPDSVRRHVHPEPWAAYIRRYRARRR